MTVPAKQAAVHLGKQRHQLQPHCRKILRIKTSTNLPPYQIYIFSELRGMAPAEDMLEEAYLDRGYATESTAGRKWDTEIAASVYTHQSMCSGG